ncbi:MAG: hypothetical protein NVSMB56_18960 [Pyrinomonadaceae bacterium]
MQFTTALIFARRALNVARIAFVALVCIAFAHAVSISARAQNPNDEDTAPPPLKRLAPEDKMKLNAARDARERTKSSIELSDERLRRAAQLTTQKDYDAAATELGLYQAVIADALKYLKQDKIPNNRQRDLFKRLELTIRAQSPRIETIRRDSPLEYAKNVKTVYDFARDARAEALEAFYGNTVLPGESSKPKDKAQNTFDNHASKPSKP